ncbi:MAG TPA: hypothetical protein PK685_03895, partial [archaeon]|nr:hypothetical protein [archaeon]
MLTTGAGVATARAIKREMPGAYDTVDEFINPAITNTTVIGPPGGPPLAGKDLINFNSQLTNQHTYISRYVGTKPHSAGQFVFNPANTADDAFLKTILPKISDSSGNLDLVKFNALDPKDLSDFKAVIDRGSYLGKKGLIQPDKAKFLSRLDTHIASKTPSSSTVVKEMTEDVLNQSLKSAKAQDKALKARAEAVQSRLDKKTKIKKPSLKAKKEISKLTDELDEVKKLQNATTERLKTFESVKANGSKGGIYTIDDAAAKTLSQADNTIATIAKPTSRLTKFGVGAGRFASDLLVMYFSNKLANEAVDVLTEEGQLNNMVYVDDTVPIKEFKKQTWYRVQIYKSENNSYSQVYTLEEPNITTENIIYYRTNTEVVKLITTEHQEEMYQTNNPQTSDPYTPRTTGSIGLNTEDIATIAELQAKMFQEKENQLKGYNDCSFSTVGSVCNNLDPLKPNYCSAFAQRVATEVYGITYNRGNACDSATVNFGTRNKVIWQSGRDSDEDFENYLIPGAALTLRNYGGSLNCDPSHVVLYVGKQNGSTQYIIHQWGNKSHLEPLFQSQGGRFNLSKNVYQIVIPENGYTLYDQFVTKTA